MLDSNSLVVGEYIFYLLHPKVHTLMLDVTPNHDFSSTKLDCFLGESWVHAGSNRPSSVFAAIGKNQPSATFPLSILSASCGPWQMQHSSFVVLSCLVVFCLMLVCEQ